MRIQTYVLLHSVGRIEITGDGLMKKAHMQGLLPVQFFFIHPAALFFARPRFLFLTLAVIFAY